MLLASNSTLFALVDNIRKKQRGLLKMDLNTKDEAENSLNTRTKLILVLNGAGGE
jgi:hypothetical protein